MLKKVIFLLVIIFSIACNPIATKTEVDKEAIRAEVLEMLHAYHKAIAADGLTAEFDYLDNSPQFFWVPPGYESALSYDSVQAILEQNASMFSQVNFSWENLNIHPLAADLASFTGIVSGAMTDTTGITSTMRIIESGTIIQREDGWKLLNGQSALLNEPIGNTP